MAYLPPFDIKSPLAIDIVDGSCLRVAEDYEDKEQQQKHEHKRKTSDCCQC